MKTTVSPSASPELQAFLAALPASFETGGRVIYTGRNTLKSFQIDGRELIVKRYLPLSLGRSLLFAAPPSTIMRRQRSATSYASSSSAAFSTATSTSPTSS